MLYKVRFSEGSDIEWQEICEKAVEEGYEIEIAVPDVIVVDTEDMTITQDRDGSFAPTVPIEEIQELLGLAGDPEDDDIENIPSSVAELEGDTIIEDGGVSIVTNLTGPIVVEKTDYMFKVTIG